MSIKKDENGKVKKVLILCDFAKGAYILTKMFEEELGKNKCKGVLYLYIDGNPKLINNISQPLSCNDDMKKKGKCDDIVRQKFNKLQEEEENCNILIANAEKYTTSVDFLGVTRLIIVNPPSSYGNYKQMIGRVSRSCQFPQEKRYNYDIHLYVSYIEDTNWEYKNFKTQDCFNYFQLKEEAKEYQQRDKMMHNISFQYAIEKYLKKVNKSTKKNKKKKINKKVYLVFFKSKATKNLIPFHL